eukprot:scaffold112531_cov18-Prasinocladus_malaysianus.AAC.1
MRGVPERAPRTSTRTRNIARGWRALAGGLHSYRTLASGIMSSYVAWFVPVRGIILHNVPYLETGITRRTSTNASAIMSVTFRLIG